VTLDVVRDEIGVYLKLPKRWDEFLASISPDLSRHIRRNARAFAANAGELRIITSEEGFDENFQILIELHQARWAGRGQPGVFASEKFTRFHRLLAAKLIPRGHGCTVRAPSSGAWPSERLSNEGWSSSTS
jgi:CelD/BcsL family acetyltransferase involved in cellulose biosynthesis